MPTQKDTPTIEVVNGANAVSGRVQTLMANDFDVRALRPYIDNKSKRMFIDNSGGGVTPVGNAVLRKDEWRYLDEEVVNIYRTRLRGVADLINAGLSMSLPNAMGITSYEYEDASDMTGAEMNMDGITRGDDDRIEYQLRRLPIPIIHKGFHFNARVLAARRRNGIPLSTEHAAVAAAKVAEYQENILFNGTSNFAFDSGTIYGYTDHPNRNTGSLTAKWDHAISDSSGAAGGEVIINDVRAMKTALIADRRYGPYVLYVPTNYETVLDDDYRAAGDDRTVRQRILQLDGIADVRVSDYLSDDNVLLVQMSRDTVRWVNGFGATPVQWDEQGGMLTRFRVMAIGLPLILKDQTGRSGIAHYTG